jgi:hypothetical protein
VNVSAVAKPVVVRDADGPDATIAPDPMSQSVVRFRRRLRSPWSAVYSRYLCCELARSNR